LDQLQRTVNAVLLKDRLLGTALNLLASLAALAALTVILGRPLDYWDIGIQVTISAAIELIVLQVLFAGGRFGWPTRRLS
jgi:hypothetical protein